MGTDWEIKRVEQVKLEKWNGGSEGTWSFESYLRHDGRWAFVLANTPDQSDSRAPVVALVRCTGFTSRASARTAAHQIMWTIRIGVGL